MDIYSNLDDWEIGDLADFETRPLNEPVCAMCNEPMCGFTMEQHRQLLCKMWPTSLAWQIKVLAEKLNDIEIMLSGEHD